MTVHTRGSGSRRSSKAALYVGRSSLGIALIVLGACSNEPQQLTHPSPQGLRFGGHGGGLGGFGEGAWVAVCVSADSPFGDYYFTIDHFTPAADGTTVLLVNIGSSFSLRPDDCVPVATRLVPSLVTTPDPVGSVTVSYTSNTVVGGADHAGTTCVDYPEIPVADPCGLTVGGFVNFDFGTDAIFSFVQTPAKMIAALRVTLAGLGLSKGTRNQLDDKLREAAKAIDKGNTSHACHELNHFIRDATEHPGKKMSTADAAMLAEKATDIMAELGC